MSTLDQLKRPGRYCTPRLADYPTERAGYRGAVPMPGPDPLTPQDIAYRCTSAEAVAAITDAAGLLNGRLPEGGIGGAPPRN